MQTVLIAEVNVLPCHGLPDGRSLGNIGLAAGILNQFLWLDAPIHLSSVRSHAFDEEVENRTENDSGENKKNETEHDGDPLVNCHPGVFRRPGLLSGLREAF